MTQQQAFTLVELAIVLVIIGLIVGGVLVGQDLIRAAELQSVATQEQKFIAAVNTFRGKYGGFPGDLTTATNYWPAAGTCPLAAPSTDTSTCNGDGDGQVGAFWPTSPESFTFWQQLGNAGLIAGSYDGFTNNTGGLPLGKPNSSVWFASYWGTPLVSINYFNTSYGNALFFVGTLIGSGGTNLYPSGAPPHQSKAYPTLRPAEASNIDNKLDDGDPAAGRVLVLDLGTIGNGATSCTDAADVNATTAHYQQTNTALTCNLIFRNAF